MLEPGLVLVVDDEQPIVDLVSRYLTADGFRVRGANDGTRALELARRERPDVVVLDLMLPGIDGLEVCRRLRQFSDAHVIMLTARTDEVDRIVGLTVGADDYVTKPFSPRELVARVRAHLRRAHGQVLGDGADPAATRIDDLVIDQGAHEVTRGGEPVPLTPLEFELLTTLAARPGLVFTREQLLEQVWGGDFYGDDHVVDVHVSNLRRKLERDPDRPPLVETVRGVGYRLRRNGT
ncbi:MAG TPA: response regulator transcription factor [Thermomicrobiaceae bacterium]|nr:response regulator transcription factor [Thermomicrobiaceae bacterium]